MKVTYRVAHPTDSYCFVEVVDDEIVTGGANADPTVFRRNYDALKAAFAANDNGFEKVETFTGETILYNPVAHEYRTLDGKKLVSGSEYKKSLEKPFDLEKIAPATAKKHGVDEAHIRDMWNRNREISAGLGTSLHQAMEQWFKHRGNGTEKNYHLPKHPFLRKAVESFPLKNCEGYPEIMVSDVANGRVGQIDLLVRTGMAVAKNGPVDCLKIVDYKSDAEVEKNLSGHWNQLSFYAHILQAKGWHVEGLEIWNYCDEWRRFESPVLPLKV